MDVTHPKIAGSLQFPEGTAVEVILYNKNPFRFEYTVDTTTQFVDRTTVKELLPLLGFPSFDKLLAESTQAEDKVESDAAAAAKFAAGARPPAPSVCDSRLAQARAYLLNLSVRRLAAVKTATGAAANLQAQQQHYDDFLTAVKESTPATSACPTLCTKAKEAADALLELANPMGLAKSLEQIAELDEQARKLPDQAIEQWPVPQKQQCAGEILALGEATKVFVADTKTIVKPLQDAAAKLAKEQDAYVAARNGLIGTLSNPTAFSSSEFIPSYAEAVTHELTLVIKDRLNPAVAPQKYPLGQLVVGSPTFSFSMGPALSFIDHRTYGKQAGQVPSATGGTVLGSVVAVTQESGESFAFVGQVNARLFPLGTWGSVNVSFGATLGDGEETTDIGLFLGPSLALRADKVFITLAYHYQETVRLAPAFAIGTPVPEDLQGDIPTRKKRVGGLLLAVTLKVR